MCRWLSGRCWPSRLIMPSRRCTLSRRCRPSRCSGVSRAQLEEESIRAHLEEESINYAKTHTMTRHTGTHTHSTFKLASCRARHTHRLNGIRYSGLTRPQAASNMERESRCLVSCSDNIAVANAVLFQVEVVTRFSIPTIRRTTTRSEYAMARGQHGSRDDGGSSGSRTPSQPGSSYD